MKNIMLVNPCINPDRCFDQLGLDYLFSSLELAGNKVTLYSMDGCDCNSIIPNISSFKPEIVGIYCNSPMRNQTLRIVALVKSFYQNAKVIFGGPHATLMPEDLLSNSSVDYVIRGEGERSLVGLVEALEGKIPIAKIPGLSYRNTKGDIVHNPTRSINDLDSLAFPYRSVKGNFSKTSKEKDFAKEYVPFIATRGCAHLCTFCSGSKLLGSHMRKRSLDDVREELEQLKCAGFDRIMLLDDNISVYPEYFNAIAKMLGDLRFGWICQSRTDIHKKFDFSKLKAYGCEQIEFGVESGSERILSYLSKGSSLSDVLASFEQCRQHNITSFANFIIGSPTESPQDVRKTFELLEAIKPDSFGLWISTPYPGTQMYRDSVDAGSLIYPQDELFEVFEKVNSFGILDFGGYFTTSPQCIQEARNLLRKSVLRDKLFKPRNNHSYISD